MSKFQPPYGPAGLGAEVGSWVRQNQGWMLRAEATVNDQVFGYSFFLPQSRAATADEIAAEIVSSPAPREALAALASPPGQAVEDAVARLYLPPSEARLLADAITLAWKTVLDESRPAWQRAEVLTLAGVVIVLIGVFAWGSRK
jgi:hypothetical protein